MFYLLFHAWIFLIVSRRTGTNVTWNENASENGRTFASSVEKHFPAGIHSNDTWPSSTWKNAEQSAQIVIKNSLRTALSGITKESLTLGKSTSVLIVRWRLILRLAWGIMLGRCIGKFWRTWRFLSARSVRGRSLWSSGLMSMLICTKDWNLTSKC